MRADEGGHAGEERAHSAHERADQAIAREERRALLRAHRLRQERLLERQEDAYIAR